LEGGDPGSTSFAPEEDACLLGTPRCATASTSPARALRLLIFDRRALAAPEVITRRGAARFGGKAYDDAQARGGYSQTIPVGYRRADDKGVFS